MAKAPDAGRVKTRLAPLLRPDEARELSACFLRDMTEMLARAGRAAIDGYIAFAPAGSEASFAPIVAPGTGYVFADGAIDAPAGVVGLGRSLLQAARALFAGGYGAVGLVNADSPTLPAELIVETARLLALPGDRAVLGPATDGGYYLIALKAPHAELFAGIDWSTPRVAAQTRAAAQRLGLELAEIAPWYDVDDPASLARLVHDCAAARTPSPRRGEGRGEGVTDPSTAQEPPHLDSAHKRAESDLSPPGRGDKHWPPYFPSTTAAWLERNGIARRLAAASAATEHSTAVRR
jgi:rSAM/selenodomain-associated transferase 1